MSLRRGPWWPGMSPVPTHADAYPEVMQDCLEFHADRNFEGMKKILEKHGYEDFKCRRGWR